MDAAMKGLAKHNLKSVNVEWGKKTVNLKA